MNIFRNHSTLLALLCMIVFVQSGCSVYKVWPNTARVPYPILMGPVHKIGGGDTARGPKLRTVEGEICSRDMTVSVGNTVQSAHRIDNDIEMKFRSSLSDTGGVVGYVKNLEAANTYHASMVIVEHVCVKITCDILNAESSKEHK